MKLYKVSRRVCEYDEYDSAIICANTPQEAIADQTATWENVEYIGIARRGLKPGCVLGSFNAG